MPRLFDPIFQPAFSRGIGRGESRVSGALPSLYLGQVATKSRIPTNNSTTNKQMNNRSHHVARDDITSLKIELPNWYWARKSTLDEKVGGGNITYRASIEYPAGVFTQVLFSGAASVVVASGNSILSDFCTVAIPNGASFWVRVFAVAVSAIVFLDGDAAPVTQQVDTGNGEAMEFAASGLSDLTMSGTITATLATVAAPIFSPTAIVAMTRKPSVLIIGDSRAWGYVDTLDSSGDLGEIARSIGPAYGYINAGSAGDFLSAFIAGGAKRAALKQYCSHVVIQTAINALRSGGSGQNKTAATVLGEQQSILAMFADKRCFVTTTAPQSGTTDNWATTANQTVNANSAQIIAFNDAVRAGVSGAVGYFDVADAVESARNSGKWKVDGTAFKWTTDGLHETQFAYLAIKNGGAINTTRITRAGL
jgi:hypothetical protein